jgi:hypothetical protein
MRLLSRRGTDEDEFRGESRWPSAGGVAAVIVLTLLMPERLLPLPQWIIAAVEGALLIALIIGDPGKISQSSRRLRGLSIGLVAVLVLGSLASTGLLIADLISGGAAVDSAGELLATGALVWASNNISFSLLYWELDCGGSAARVRGMPASPDFAFPQQLNPEVAPPGWRPQFVDYLYLGFTNATAFSPTDAMPLTPGSKLAMGVQALISLAILGLVVARAVNVLA